MEDRKTSTIIDRTKSYVNHISHIQNIPNPHQTQYMNYSHSITYSFPKEKKCKIKTYI